MLSLELIPVLCMVTLLLVNFRDGVKLKGVTEYGVEITRYFGVILPR